MKLRVKPVLQESLQRSLILKEAAADRGPQTAPAERHRLYPSSGSEKAEKHQSCLLLLPGFGKISHQVFCICSLWWSLTLPQASKQETFPRTLSYPHTRAKTGHNLTDAMKAMRRLVIYIIWDCDTISEAKGNSKTRAGTGRGNCADHVKRFQTLQ